MAIVYLIHFDHPIGNLENPRAMAQHYIGYSRQFKSRMMDHVHGRGAAIMAYVAQAKIGWLVARKWSNGTRYLERKLKNRKRAADLCPICRAIKGKV